MRCAPVVATLTIGSTPISSSTGPRISPAALPLSTPAYRTPCCSLLSAPHTVLRSQYRAPCSIQDWVDFRGEWSLPISTDAGVDLYGRGGSPAAMPRLPAAKPPRVAHSTNVLPEPGANQYHSLRLVLLICTTRPAGLYCVCGDLYGVCADQP
eukprot:1070172-Rhodomonas_salina.2